MHLRDLQQLLGPVELFASGLADLDESVDDFEHAVERVRRLLHEHLQSSAQTLLLGLGERAALLLEEIEELEVEREGLVALQDRLHEALQRRRVAVRQAGQLQLQQRGLAGVGGVGGVGEGAQLGAQLLAALEHLQAEREVHARRRGAVGRGGRAGATARNARNGRRGGGLHLHPWRWLD